MICLPEVSYPNTYLSKITTKDSKIWTDTGLAYLNKAMMLSEI